MVHIELGKLVKDKALHDGFDEKFQSWIINEDKVCDELEDLMQEGGKIVDHHGCDFFPERWFDLVIVLRANNEVLYPRLEKRGYPQHKISENIECEIMEVISCEARESYASDIVVELRSETLADMQENVDRILAWIESYRQNHADEEGEEEQEEEEEDDEEDDGDECRTQKLRIDEGRRRSLNNVWNSCGLPQTRSFLLRSASAFASAVVVGPPPPPPPPPSTPSSSSSTTMAVWPQPAEAATHFHFILPPPSAS